MGAKVMSKAGKLQKGTAKGDEKVTRSATEIRDEWLQGTAAQAPAPGAKRKAAPKKVAKK